MKRVVSIMAFAACFLAVSTAVWAQDCSKWSNWDLRGTYTMSGQGFIDLSKMLPGMGLPAGMIPMSWVGAHTYNGLGGGSGWVSINSGGSQMTADMDITTSMKSDCSVQVTFTMKIRGLGITIGPFQRLAVIAPKPEGLELHMMLAGHPPGQAPGAGLDLGVSRRISRDY